MDPVRFFQNLAEEGRILALYLCIIFDKLTLWRPAAFGDFQKKTLKRTWLCAGISPLLFRLQTWSKRQKMWQVF